MIDRIIAGSFILFQEEVFVGYDDSAPSGNGKRFIFVSVPTWYGAGKRGTEYGPAAFKKFGLEEKLRLQGLKMTGWCQVDPEPIRSANSSALNYESEIAFTERGVFRIVNGLLLQGYTPIILGGDHTVSIGSISAHAIHAGAARKVGVIWIDAHGDVHTPDTSLSKHIHGMPLAVLLGHGSKKLIATGEGFHPKVFPYNIVHIGGNNFEDEEIKFFAQHQIPVFSGVEISTDEGFTRACTAITKLGGRIPQIVVSIDMDAFDETIAPGVHARNKNGITREKAIALFDHIKAHCHVAGIDIAEIVPQKDRGHKTIELAYDFLLRLLAS